MQKEMEQSEEREVLKLKHNGPEDRVNSFLSITDRCKGISSNPKLDSV